MANIYESYGRLQERHEQECEGHRRTVGILADLKAGRLRIDQVEVDVERFSWKAFPGREKPGRREECCGIGGHAQACCDDGQSESPIADASDELLSIGDVAERTASDGRIPGEASE